MPATGSLAPSPTRDVHESVNARRLVTLHLQQAVNAGRAEWRINVDGETELHVNTGEVFLLREAALTRLK